VYQLIHSVTTLVVFLLSVAVLRTDVTVTMTSAVPRLDVAQAC
jgi:hypothetical protein